MKIKKYTSTVLNPSRILGMQIAVFGALAQRQRARASVRVAHQLKVYSNPIEWYMGLGRSTTTHRAPCTPTSRTQQNTVKSHSTPNATHAPTSRPPRASKSQPRTARACMRSPYGAEATIPSPNAPTTRSSTSCWPYGADLGSKGPQRSPRYMMELASCSECGEVRMLAAVLGGDSRSDPCSQPRSALM